MLPNMIDKYNAIVARDVFDSVVEWPSMVSAGQPQIIDVLGCLAKFSEVDRLSEWLKLRFPLI